MELKEYQAKTLDAFSEWLRELDKAGQEAAKGVAALESVGLDVPAEMRNYPRRAWESLAAAGGVADPKRAYVARTDEAGHPIPHVCFKIPTGGGKTLLGAAALERMNRSRGLVLWITPTTAIYQQTKATFWDREHPYRQMLERASGGRVKMLEKDNPFTYGDVTNYLCVMLLMLPAANRRKGRDFLRMFRDSGRYPTLFPASDDPLGHGKLLEQHPDLDRDSESGPVKHSLFNAFKMLRPVVVLDEAHKAYGKADEARDFVRAVNRLDPRTVIELSATPNRSISNLLVDVAGTELKNEEMIKLPVQVKATRKDKVDWQHTLGEAHEELEKLDAEARDLQQSDGTYIRPIAVVRVERTGRDQRDRERIHAEDVREHLTRNLGVPEGAVRVKSSDADELGKEDLLSETSPVRWIITKAALMEGWDCPFAYILVMLDNTKAQRAITQLVGRVLRQPYAKRTNRPKLDQCYVHCLNTDIGVAVEQVKAGLEQEGLDGLGDQVLSDASELQRRVIQRREKFRQQAIFLPVVNHREGGGWRELDYESHILSEIDWASIRPPDPQLSLAEGATSQWATVDVGDTPTVYHADQELYVDKTISISWFARRLADLVPNPWQAARIVQELVELLRSAGLTDDDIYDGRGRLVANLRDHLAHQVDKQAKGIFESKLRSETIDFSLDVDKGKYEMQHSYRILVGPEDGTLQRYGNTVQLSLFEPQFERQFDSKLERDFAFYLDEQRALQWWHRVAVRQQGEYYLRGWRKDRIWPDFIALGGEKAGQTSFLVFETKGEHLRGNPDTEYKQAVFQTLENAFNRRATPAGKVTVHDGPAAGVFRLVFDKPGFPDAAQALRPMSATYHTP